MSEKFDIFQEVTDTIMAALEEGTVPWRKPWTFTGDDSMHRNFTSRRPYRGVNQWLLDIQAAKAGYEHPYWLTFKGAETIGGKIRKGEKSTMVVFWKILKVEDKETGKPKTVPMLRYFRVFNVAQCEGIEIPPVKPRPAFDPIDAAQAIVDGMPNRPVFKHDGRERAFYIPAFDEVHMPAREDFKSPEGYYATAFHELVHSTGHASRLARKELAEIRGFGSDTYCREELTAEMGSAMLCGVAGIAPATLDNSAAYIASWLKALRDDRKLVVVAAGKAHAAADYILGTDTEN